MIEGEIVVAGTTVAEITQLGTATLFLTDCGSAILAFEQVSGRRRTGKPLLPSLSRQYGYLQRISGS